MRPSISRLSLRRPTPLMVVLYVLTACGYTVLARPALPGGVMPVTIPVLENDTSETELGVIMATALARRAEADGRLARSNDASAKLVGRIEAIRASPEAFPVIGGGAGMYGLTLRVRLRLISLDGGSTLSELTVGGREQYLAGSAPEETEANRRLALERLSVRLADEAWSRLTAPQSRSSSRK